MGRKESALRGQLMVAPEFLPPQNSFSGPSSRRRSLNIKPSQLKLNHPNKSGISTQLNTQHHRKHIWTQQIRDTMQLSLSPELPGIKKQKVFTLPHNS
jgi:hypothetical protein